MYDLEPNVFANATQMGLAPILVSSVRYTDEHWVEDAVRFMVCAFEGDGIRKEKPIIVHSLRVGFYLYHMQADRSICLSGFLHDVVENTNLNHKALSSRFGKKVSQIVQANSMDKSNGSWQSRYKDSLKRCSKIGTDALCVRAADVIDNSRRHMSTDRTDRYNRMISKIDMLEEAFSQVASTHLSDRVLDDLNICRSRLITG